MEIAESIFILIIIVVFLWTYIIHWGNSKHYRRRASALEKQLAIKKDISQRYAELKEIVRLLQNPYVAVERSFFIEQISDSSYTVMMRIIIEYRGCETMFNIPVKKFVDEEDPWFAKQCAEEFMMTCGED